MPSWAQIILGVVLLQRLGELYYAQSNTKKLLAEGGVEHGADHYPVLVLVHAAWLVALAFSVPPEAPVSWPWTALYGVLLALRAWVMLSLGRFWTTRIVTLPGAPLVARGPYRWLRHPNYAVVVAEIFVAPMIFGQMWIALIFSALNGAALYSRIRVENAVLAERRGLTSPPENSARP